MKDRKINFFYFVKHNFFTEKIIPISNAIGVSSFIDIQIIAIHNCEYQNRNALYVLVILSIELNVTAIGI